jgi:hypothetical protein
MGQISEEIKDFAGELSNIILGNTKILWNEKGYIFESELGIFYAIISILWD